MISGTRYFTGASPLFQISAIQMTDTASWISVISFPAIFYFPVMDCFKLIFSFLFLLYCQCEFDWIGGVAVTVLYIILQSICTCFIYIIFSVDVETLE